MGTIATTGRVYVVCADVETEGRHSEVFGPYDNAQAAKEWLAEVHIEKGWDGCSEMHTLEEHPIYPEGKLPKRFR